MSIDDDSEPLTVTDPDGLARMIDLRFHEGDLDAVRAGELLVAGSEMTSEAGVSGRSLPVVFPTAGSCRCGSVPCSTSRSSVPAALRSTSSWPTTVVADLGIERGDRLCG